MSLSPFFLRFNVRQKCAVSVLQAGVGDQHRVVGLHHGRGHLRGGVDGELKLRVLDIIADPLGHEVHNLLADDVVAPGVVVCDVLLASDNLVNHRGLEIHERSVEHDPGHGLAAPGLGGEGVETVILWPDVVDAGNGAVRLDVQSTQ